MHAFLQIALDPRTVFVLGLLFFGGIVAWAEITHSSPVAKDDLRQNDPVTRIRQTADHKSEMAYVNTNPANSNSRASGSCNRPASMMPIHMPA